MICLYANQHLKFFLNKIQVSFLGTDCKALFTLHSCLLLSLAKTGRYGTFDCSKCYSQRSDCCLGSLCLYRLWNYSHEVGRWCFRSQKDSKDSSVLSVSLWFITIMAISPCFHRQVSRLRITKFRSAIEHCSRVQ